MKATASVQTTKGLRYMKAMVIHFGQKTNTSYDENSGYAEFNFGRCDIEVDEESISFKLDSPDAEGLKSLKFVVDKHISRFSRNEIESLSWQSAS